jgi:hypothetical protein
MAETPTKARYEAPSKAGASRADQLAAGEDGVRDDDVVEDGDDGRDDSEEIDDQTGNEEDDDDDYVDESKWPDIHREAIEEYERGWERERSNIEEAYDDLRFKRGRVSDQWDPIALQARKGRPTHVNNKIPQFIRQVTGDQRQMRPSIEVVPTDSGADQDVADIRGGIIRYIENRSHAKWIYNQAGDSQVACGIGHWEVETEYAHAGTFNQEIRISLIEDGVAVIWDADAKLLTREDANHCFVPSDRTTAAFQRDWPDARADGFDTTLGGKSNSGAFDSWVTDDFIRQMVYWKKMPLKRLLGQGPDGAMQDLTEKTKDYTPQQVKQLIREGKTRGIRIGMRDSYRICRFLMTTHEILEEKSWKGMHIPVIPIIGEETRIAREIHRTGLVRPVKDLQRMVNYYASAETEVIALQPKAPYLGTKVMFQDRYDLWDTANTEMHPFLEYTPDRLVPSGKPERIRPPDASAAIQQGAITAAADMKEVLGIYNASLGAKSNETSGIAIKERDRQGDTGTFLYTDNMALAILRTAVVVDDLVPHVYDTERQMRIIGNDGKQALVTINRARMIEGKADVENDLSVGAYDVSMEQGPSYATKREESRDGMMEFIKAVPNAAPLIGDLIAQNQDWNNAKEIGERLQEMLPPPIKQKRQQEQAEREQASGKPPKPPSPQQMQAEQQAQQAQQQQQALQQQEIALKMAEQKARTDEMEAKARKANADADLAEAKAAAYKQVAAAGHMDELRKIEAHDHEISATVQARHHAQDRHEVDMTHQGLDAFGKIQGQVTHGAAAKAEMARMQQEAQQGQEQHDASMEQGAAAAEQQAQAAQQQQQQAAQPDPAAAAGAGE